MKPITQRFWHKVGCFSVIGMAFAIPISTAMTTLCMGLVLLAWCIGSDKKQKREVFYYHPLTRWLIPLIALTLLGVAYSEGDFNAIHHALMDGLRLASIPVFIYYARDEKIAQRVLWAFCAAMIVTLLLAFLKVKAGVPIGMKYTVGAVFKSHIKTSFFMAMAALFLVYQVQQYPRYRWVFIVILTAMLYYLLFMSAGRIGYLTLGVCILLLFWRGYQWRGLMGACVMGLILFGGAYMTSSVFSDRIHLLAQDVEFYQQGGRLLESSLGQRLHFIDASVQMILQHPILGSGTGSFGQAYATLHQNVIDPFLTDNPHNEYLRVGVELGVIGLLLLLALFYQQWRLSWQLPSEHRGFCQGMLLTFFLGCCLNSWLSDFTEAYFYCLMTAVCFAPLPLLAKRTVPSARVVIH